MTTRDSHIGSNTNTVCPIKSQLIQIRSERIPSIDLRLRENACRDRTPSLAMLDQSIHDVLAEGTQRPANASFLYSQDETPRNAESLSALGAILCHHLAHGSSNLFGGSRPSARKPMTAALCRRSLNRVTQPKWTWLPSILVSAGKPPIGSSQPLHCQAGHRRP